MSRSHINNLYVLQLIVMFIACFTCNSLVFHHWYRCHCQLSIPVVSRRSFCCQMPTYNCCHRCILYLSVSSFHAKVIVVVLAQLLRLKSWVICLVANYIYVAQFNATSCVSCRLLVDEPAFLLVKLVLCLP